MTRIDLVDLPTWVYRCTCSHESLLYVGVAFSVDRRLAQHKATKDWWGEVAFIDAELYESRDEALDVEAFYIRTGRPKYNIAGMPPISDVPLEPSGRRFYINPPAGVVLQSGQGIWR